MEDALGADGDIVEADRRKRRAAEKFIVQNNLRSHLYYDIKYTALMVDSSPNPQ
jgi:hypothetical protein